MSMNEEQVKSYIANAAANFSTPDEVVDHTELSVAQKRKILQSWQVDEEELVRATEENMGKSESNRLSQVVDALKRLDN
ncbi:MAG: hypothetical protein RKH07_03945 [Gammaproteobacteria bacterium]